MLVDLHMHSYFSDGTMSPTEIIEEAKRRNVEIKVILKTHDYLMILLHFTILLRLSASTVAK